MNPYLDVVIVNYNVCFFLEQALFSLARACQRMEDHGMAVQVWVVDNNSVDGSVKMVREKFPWVTLIANQDNRGFSRANNQAIREGTGRYVLLLNPDTVVEENTLLDSVHFMDNHPEAGGLGIKMVDGKGHFLPESKRGLPTPWVAFYKMSGLAKLFANSPRFGRYHLSYLDPEETHEIEVLAGAFMLMRREALDEVGLLDEDFFMYGEDIDLSYRLIKGGYKNYYFPGTRIIHYKGESTRKASVNYVLVFYRAMILFARKHFTSRRARIFTVLIQMAIYLRAGAAVVARFSQRLALPILDFTLLYGANYTLGQLYAEEVKNRADYYADEVFQLLLPAIILLYLLGLQIAGAYHRPYHFNKTARGTALGALLVIGAYAFLPNDYRFSRALILLWPLLSIFIAHFARILYRSVAAGRPMLTESTLKRLIVVGEEEEAERTQALLYQSMPGHRVVGFVRTSEKEASRIAYLGSLRQMDEIIQIHRPDEVVFCARDLPSREIINWMMHLSRTEIYFKIVPEKSLFIIGSNSKHTAGDFYTLQLDLNLARPDVRRLKRLTDIVLATLIMSLWPLLSLRHPRPGRLWRAGWLVLLGQFSWVGYTNSPQKQASPLPPLRQGIFSTRDQYHLEKDEQEKELISQIDLVYARDYHIWRDWHIVSRNLGAVGRP